MHALRGAIVVAVLSGAAWSIAVSGAPLPQASAPQAGDLVTTINQLGSFDFAVRTEAARRVRRADAAAVVPLLDRAVRTNTDQYVRFRAMVILAAFDGTVADRAMRDMLVDRNDRLRTTAYQWFEHHPDPAVLPALIGALSTENSEFVRPALTRAIAAFGSSAPAAREALLPLVTRGEDLFRGALIDALGDYRARWALSEIVGVARLDGPLQDDAISAIGKIGDPASAQVLGELQREAEPEALPTIAAAFCLLGVDCAARQAYLTKTLAFAASQPDEQPVLRGVVHALGVLATNGHGWALAALLDAGVPASDPARAAITLGVGLVTLRATPLVLRTVETRSDAPAVVELIRDAFDMLSEDFDEERCYAELRRAYWAAPANSATRRTAQMMIEKLEF